MPLTARREIKTIGSETCPIMVPICERHKILAIQLANKTLNERGVIVRPYSAECYSQLKAATKRALELAAPLSKITECTRLDAATLSRAANPECSNFIPIDDAMNLDRLCGEPLHLQAMAKWAGYNLVPFEHLRQATNLVLSAGSAAKITGEMVAETITDLSDGDLTCKEARRIDNLCAESESVVSGIRDGVHGVLSAGK